MQTFLKFCLFLVGPFVFGCALALFGIGAYVWLAQPKRLAVAVPPNETNAAIILSPQPSNVSVNQTNVFIVAPPIKAYFTGAATNAKVWAHGNAFESGGAAAWELLYRAWPLLGISSVTLIYWLLRQRWDRSRTDSLETNNQVHKVDDYSSEKSTTGSN